jgi:hypothetical protein
MTALLEKAVKRTAGLSATEQDEAARPILEALDAQDDRLWDRQFEQSEDVLSLLASDALADYHAGCRAKLNT